MKPSVLLLVIALLPTLCPSQSQPSWSREEKSDPLRGTHFVQFSLEGRYLAAPRHAPPSATPAMIARCIPGSYNHGHSKGKFLNGYIFVDGVVDTGQAGSVHVQYRLDDGKLQSDVWSHSTDFSSVFFSAVDFNNLLYGHLLAHKEGTNPQIRKAVVGLEEFLGAEIVVQFDMPDATEVAETCGVIWQK
jgi:hypothetical protein